MRSLALVLAFAAAQPIRAETFDLRAYVYGRGAYATGPRTWLTGNDWGRFAVSGDGIGEGRGTATLNAEVGLDWNPSDHFGAHVHILGRAEPESWGGKRAGVVAAYLEGRVEEGAHRFQARAGQFFLPTSRENKADLWYSPYTITWSTLNSWIGEEVRPIGLDLEHRFTTAGGHILTTGATAFVGNDTMGTLVGWRGWSMGNRLSVYNEVVPLPPLWSLQFFPQREDGTTPFRDDLDGRIGYAARVRYSLPERAMIQYTRLDNRGDRLRYGGEYSWETRFDLVGAELGYTETTIAAFEYMRGVTYMGVDPRGTVDAHFMSSYLLLSHRRDRNRFSARYEIFNTEEGDFSPAENNDEDGSAWTLAWFFDVTENWRTGLEFTQITGERVSQAQSGFDPRFDGRSVVIEVRYALR